MSLVWLHKFSLIKGYREWKTSSSVTFQTKHCNSGCAFFFFTRSFNFIYSILSEACDLEAFDSGSELGFFKFKNFLFWV